MNKEYERPLVEILEVKTFEDRSYGIVLKCPDNGCDIFLSGLVVQKLFRFAQRNGWIASSMRYTFKSTSARNGE